MPVASVPIRSLHCCAWTLALVVAGAHAAEPADAGLVGEYFANSADYPPAESKKGPFFVRVDPKIDFASTEGPFYGSKLSESFGVRWTGVLRVDKAGSYVLTTESDDGSRLAIDGKQVVDNGGLHGMQKKSATVELSAGDHALKLEFFQGEAGAGCRLLWTPPGGAEAAIPASALFHKPGAEKIAWDEEAWKKAKGAANKGRFAEMDHGPFVGGTIVAAGNNVAMKGIGITLDKKKEALACFDAELLRMSFGGIAFIRHPTGRDGLEGQPQIEGTATFATKMAPGWGKAGDFKDPRTGGQGPLPRDWGHYRGLYLHGDQVILSYSVGQASVLESPAFETAGGADAVCRSFTTSGSEALTLLVADNDQATGSVADGIAVLDKDGTCTAAGLVGGPATAKFTIADKGRVLLTVPASAKPFKLALWTGAKADLPAFAKFLAAAAKPVDLNTLTKGGPPRWTPTLETKGELGNEDGPYVVDTITVPYETPWKCYMRVTANDFFSDGRAAIATIDGDVWIVSGIDDKLDHLVWKRYATGLFQALGLKIVDDVVYVTCRDQICRLRDLNNDGEADFYESFNNDCPVTKNYHEFAHDLQIDAEGNFYFCKGSSLGKPTNDYQGCVIKISKDGSTSAPYATGLRAPNGMVGPGYPLTNSDNQGNWMPACRVNLIKPGGFYGQMENSHRSVLPTTYDPPICWTPYALDNSSGGQAWVSSSKWGPLKDRLILLSYGTSVLWEIMMEETDGIPQGALVKFPLKFNSGIMRGRFNPKDGQLYVSGLKGWQTNAAKEGGFQRVRYTGKPVYMPNSFHVLADGISIGFDQALDPASAGDVGNYNVEQWNYLYTGNYGSPDVSTTDPKKKGRDPVKVEAVVLSPDKKTITLKFAGIAPVMQMCTKLKIAAADGTKVQWDVYNTINKVPGGK